MQSNLLVAESFVRHRYTPLLPEEYKEFRTQFGPVSVGKDQVVLEVSFDAIRLFSGGEARLSVAFIAGSVFALLCKSGKPPINLAQGRVVPSHKQNFCSLGL